MDAIPQFTTARLPDGVKVEIAAAVGRVLASGRFVYGAENRALEAEIAAFLQAQSPAPRESGRDEAVRALTCASGTDALLLALHALEADAQTTVVTTPFTFFATAEAPLLAGARIAFADIEPGSLNLDPEQASLAMARVRRAGRRCILLPVHLYGRMAAMAELARAAREHEAALVEDAAQAFGCVQRGVDGGEGGGSGVERGEGGGSEGAKSEAGRSEGGVSGSGVGKSGAAGCIGAIGCFSFYPTKNLGGIGEGGLVTTRSPELAARLEQLRAHGSERRYVHEIVGWNSRLDEIQAAALRVKLRYVHAWNRRRRQIAESYSRLLAGSDVATPELADDHSFHQYVIRAPRRDELRAALQRREIGTDVYYPMAAHLQPALRGLGLKQGDFPQAERAAAEVLALPMFPELTDGEVERVCAAVREFYGN
jgi:dTDP-4-amino-4,6-dideoxygalactose transaminase